MYTWLPKPRAAGAHGAVSGQAYPMARSSAAFDGVTLVMRPCSFCSVTRITFALMPQEI